MGRVTSHATYGTEKASLIYDRTYKPNGTMRGVIHCHGLNGQAWHPVNFPEPVQDEMARRGHMVMCPDLGGTATWGNDTAQQKITDAITYLNANGGVKPGGVLLWAGSMGTLAALNYLRGAGAASVAAVAVGLPAVDLVDLHDNAVARGITVASVEGAYGGSLTAYNATRVAHNPSENAAAYASLRSKVRLWYADDDTTVIPARVTAFAQATGITAVSMGSTGGHVFAASYAPQVCDWLESF
jgi:alpha-beta hydrolase superfamily lysophospholipase